MNKQEMAAELQAALEQIGDGVEVIWDMEIVGKHFEPARERIRKVIAAMNEVSHDEALHSAVAAIYFADNSDYLSGLWAVVRNLDPKVADLLEKDEKEAYAQTYERVNGKRPD